MRAEPRGGGPVGTFACDSFGDVERVLPPVDGQVERVAAKAFAGRCRRSKADAAGDRLRAPRAERLIGTGVRVLLLPDQIFLLGDGGIGPGLRCGVAGLDAARGRAGRHAISRLPRRHGDRRDGEEKDRRRKKRGLADAPSQQSTDQRLHRANTPNDPHMRHNWLGDAPSTAAIAAEPQRYSAIIIADRNANNRYRSLREFCPALRRGEHI